MSNMEVSAAMAEWSDRKLRADDIPLRLAAASFETDNPLVQAKKGLSDSRWIVSSRLHPVATVD